MYLMGGSNRGAMLALNPVGAVWWVGATAAYEGVGPSNGNDGRSPKAPLASIAQALTNCVAGRGDRIILMPGTYSITAALALNKDDVSICSLRPYAAIIDSPNTTGAAKCLVVTANDFEIDGIVFNCGDQVTHGIAVADGVASSRGLINDCVLLGAGAVTASFGVLLGDGTYDAADVVINDCVLDRFKFGLEWNGTRPKITGNTIVIPSTSGATGINVPARASIAVRSFGQIRKNAFIGSEDAGPKPAMIFVTSEAGSPMYVFDGNVLANCSTVTANIHPEGIGMNYMGTATSVAPSLITG